MKKIMMLIMVALLMLGVSGQAMASFEEGHLIRVVYSGTGAGTEYVTDLGNLSTLTSPITSPNSLPGTDTFSLSSVGASSWNNVNIAYFILDTSAFGGSGTGWTSGSAANGGYTNSGAYGSFAGAAALTTNSWGMYSGGATSVNVQQADFASYWQWLNMANGGAPNVGSMGGLLQAPGASAEANLGQLATTGYVDQILYYYGATPDSGARGTAVATIRTLLNGTGSTSLLAAPSAVPIPAAVYLFGSGLLGMFGLRRKMAA